MTTLEAETAVLRRVLVPTNPTWTRGMAEALLALRLPDADRIRMEDLAARGKFGALTADERTEAEAYDRIGVLIEVMQSIARLAMESERLPC